MFHKVNIIGITVALVTGLPTISANADLADELDGLVGYTIAASKTIDGWHNDDVDEDDEDDDGEEDGFEGCEHGRLIRFTDGTSLVCNEYGYQYAYMPTAIILAKSFQYQGRNITDIKMIVEDEVYDMQPVF